MILYKVLYKNYKLKRTELLGVLPERRKDLRGKSQHEAGTKWAKLIFGNLVKDNNAIFVTVKEPKNGATKESNP